MSTFHPSVNPPQPDQYDDPTGAEDALGDFQTLTEETGRDSYWIVWRRRTPGAVDKNTNPSTPTYVCKILGALDLDELKRTVGGGSFRVCGYTANGRKFGERSVTFEGPRKLVADDSPPVIPAATVSPVVTVQSAAPASDLVVLLQRMDARLDRLERTPLAAPVAPPVMSFSDVIEAAKAMKGERSDPDANVVSSMVGILQQGIELGKSAVKSGGEPAGTDWAVVVEKVAPSLERLLGAMLARRPMPAQMRRPMPANPAAVQSDKTPSPSGSVAEVIPDDQAGDPEPGNVRMAAVVDALARAIDGMGTPEEIEPADFAVTVETILSPLELSTLRIGTTDQLMGELSGLVDRFPALGKAQARPYVDAVLSALRDPGSDEG